LAGKFRPAHRLVAVQHTGTIDGIMIAPDYLKRIAAWSRDLNDREIEIARAGISERSYRANEYIFMRGDDFEYWTGALFNPILYPEGTRHLEITQEEIGALSGISRQNANQCLKRLEKEGLLRLEYGGVTVIDLDRLRNYGE
jgi:CRP-like cAMP-binding protein